MPLTHSHVGTPGYQVPFSEQMILGEPTTRYPESHWTAAFSGSTYLSLFPDRFPFSIFGFRHRAVMETQF